MRTGTKELIMDTAWKHFSLYGYTDTNLERICKDAGITRGPLYYYFIDKEDLYRQIVIRETHRVEKEYTDILSADCSLMETVMRLVNLGSIYNPILQRANAVAPEVPRIDDVYKLNETVLQKIYCRFEKAVQGGQVKKGHTAEEMVYFLYTFTRGIITFDEKINISNNISFYKKEFAKKIFLDNFRQQYIKE